MNNKKFVPFTSFFCGIDEIRNDFSSYTALVNAANLIIDYFEEMHSKNLFGGIDDKCININIDSGEIKIIRNTENISLKYKAPELITKKLFLDNTNTDNFTLAVILFRLFFIDHPFEGKIDYALVPLLTNKISEMLYGYEPVFVYSPNNSSNRPLSNLSPYLTARWSKTPQELQNAFTKTFTDGLENEKSRLSAAQWKELINSIMDMGVFIDGNLYIVNPDDTSALPPECVVMKISNRKIIITDNSSLIVSYKENTTPLYANVFSHNNQNILVFENITDDTWIVYKSDGQEEYIKPKEKVYLVSGDCIDFGSESGQVI